jgi:NADPH:quinone reductase-like Zn-dependent oxidoreductase
VEEYAPNGVDLAYDANGVETLKESFNHLAPCGKLFFYGAHSMFPKEGGKVNWPKLIKDYLRTPSFNPLNMSHLNRSLITFNLSFLFDKNDIFSEAMDHLLKWYSDDQIKVSAVKSFQFDEVANAHKELETGKSIGKLVLIP